MKKCPNCGFVPSLSNKQRLALYQKYFPDMPVFEMIQRGWIVPKNPDNLEEVLECLLKFSDSKNVEEFKQKFGYEGELFDTIEVAKTKVSRP